jgi:hypothetical protein
VLRSPPRSRKKLLDFGLVRTAKALLTKRGFHEETKKFELKGLDSETGRVEVVDVLADQLIATKTMLRESDRGRAVDAKSAYAAIEAAFDEHRKDLLLAAGVVR